MIKMLLSNCRIGRRRDEGGRYPLSAAMTKNNQDIVKFIYFFMPKGTKINQRTVQIAIRHLHLGFKGLETEEIYDVLMSQLIRAIAKYDPKYTEKVKEVVDVIDEKLHSIKQIQLADVNQHVGFDSHRYLRLLCRRGYLTISSERAKKKPA